MFFDLPSEIHHACQSVLDADIEAVKYLGGGDINQARLLETSRGKFFLKMNIGEQAKRMFEAEKKGLEFIEKNKGTILAEIEETLLASEKQTEILKKESDEDLSAVEKLMKKFQ